MATRRHYHARKRTAVVPLAPHQKTGCVTTHATPLRGLGLRFVIVNELQTTRHSLTVAELVDRLQRRGYTFDGRASKAISDSLRTSMTKRRVRRIRRGVYQFVAASRSTLRRIRVMARHCHEYVVAQTRPPNPPTTSPWDSHHWIWRI